MGIENKFRTRTIAPDGGFPEKDNQETKKEAEDRKALEARNIADREARAKAAENAPDAKPEDYVQKNMFEEELGETEEKAITGSEKSNNETDIATDLGTESAPQEKIEELKGKLGEAKNPEKYYQAVLGIVEEVDKLSHNDSRREAFLKNSENQNQMLSRAKERLKSMLADKLISPEQRRFIENGQTIIDTIQTRLDSMREGEGNQKEKGEDKEKEVSPDKSKEVMERVVTSLSEVNYEKDISSLENFNSRGVANIPSEEMTSVATQITSNLETNVNKSRDLKNIVENNSISDVDTKISNLEETSKELSDKLAISENETEKAELQAKIQELINQIKILREINLLKDKIVQEISRINYEIDKLKDQIGYTEEQNSEKVKRSSYDTLIDSQVKYNKEILKIAVK